MELCVGSVFVQISLKTQDLALELLVFRLILLSKPVYFFA